MAGAAAMAAPPPLGKIMREGFLVRTEYLLEEQVKVVLSLLTPSNRLVCEVSLHTGLRVGDVLALKTAQIKPRFWIKEQKTGKKRLVGLPEDLRYRLLAQAGDVYVFPSRLDPNRPRTRQAVWADVKRAQKAYRLPQNVGPHSFRKDYAVSLMERYGDIDKVRRALNHGSVITTQIYAMADCLLLQHLNKGCSYKWRQGKIR